MRELLRSTLAQNAKYLAVGIGAFALAGGTATTVSLSSSATPSPRSSHAPAKAPHAATGVADTADEAETADTNDAGDTGVRPTDTHGYCVSHAVAAAKAANKTGRDIAAAAHSCPKPGNSADKGKAGVHGKAGNHGKSSTAPGRTHAP